MDTLAGERAPVALGVVVRVDGYPRSGLGCPVQPRSVRRADLDPRPHRTGPIAHLERRLIGVGEPLREGESLAMLEAEREHPGAQKRLALRWMSRDAQVDRFVDIAIHVRELHAELMNRSAKSHREPRESVG